MCTQCMLEHAFLHQNKLRWHDAGVADVRLGEISSILVALRILIASSDSCLLRYVRGPQRHHGGLYTYLPISTLRELPYRAISTVGARFLSYPWKICNYSRDGEMRGDKGRLSANEREPQVKLVGVNDVLFSEPVQKLSTLDGGWWLVQWLGNRELRHRLATHSLQCSVPRSKTAASRWIQRIRAAAS